MDIAKTGYSGQMIIDADVTEHGWDIVLRFSPDDMEAGWSGIHDNGLRLLAPAIGTAIVEALIHDRKDN